MIRNCRDVYWAMEPRHFRSLPWLNGDGSPSPKSAIRNPKLQNGFGLSTDLPGYAVHNGVAVIGLQGVLGKGDSWWTDTDMLAVAEQVRAAAADPQVSAILLHIDSPGGTVAGTSDLADAVWKARQNKPVTAFISDLGASAAYYVASQANRILGDVDALVGSIGVYCVVPDYSQMAARVGVKVHVIRAGEMKGAGEMGAPVSDAQLADFQREVDQLNETFVDAVARGRGWPRAQVEKLNDGRVHVGAHAVRMGLLDRVATFDQAVQAAGNGTALKIRALREIAISGQPDKLNAER